MFDLLSQKIHALFSSIRGNKGLTSHDVNKVCSQMSEILIDADVPLKVAREFIDQINKEALDLPDVSGKKGIKVDDQIVSLVYKKMVSFLGGEPADLFDLTSNPSVIMVVGIQGSGKTTTIAKLAHYASEQVAKQGVAKKILVASIDFYRPAAIDQLKIMAQRAGVDCYVALNSDPVEAAKEIYDYFKKERYDLLFLDTAGRLHVDEGMIGELKKVRVLINPQKIVLVLDAMTGQESLAIAQSFDTALSFDGALLTKMDSDTRGGAAFSFRYAIGKPIFFVGYGEKIDDLQLFYPDRIAQRMLGMGDLDTLCERVDLARKSHGQVLEERMISGDFDLQDFAQQISMISSMGSIAQVAQYIPGMGQIPRTELEKMEKQMARQRAIISSMTPKERQDVRIINVSRKKRIAQGAGLSIKDVDALLKYFEESRRCVKLIKKQGSLKQMFRK